MKKYFFSSSLLAFLNLTVNRLRRGMGASLLLTGAPGAGKTSFAKAMANELGGSFHYYSCTPNKSQDLLFDYDVSGIIKRENAWRKGAAWKAFEGASNGLFAVLLIDEIDKATEDFDSFLLRLLEEWSFESPEGEVKADPTRIAVVLTSNGRRKLRPEVLRRCQRVSLELPTGDRLRQIILQEAGREVPPGLLDLVIRMGEAVRKASEESAPSPKELALLIVDLLCLAESGCDDAEVWRQVAVSYLVKKGGGAALGEAVGFKKWPRALMSEAKKK